MATHSSVLAWRIPWTEGPGGLQSMGSQRLRHTLATQMVKSLPAVRETWVRSLDQGDPLEKEMATHSSLLAWEIPWTEKPGGYSPWGHKESVDTTERLNISISSSRAVGTKKSTTKLSGKHCLLFVAVATTWQHRGWGWGSGGMSRLVSPAQPPRRPGAGISWPLASRGRGCSRADQGRRCSSASSSARPGAPSGGVTWTMVGGPCRIQGDWTPGLGLCSPEATWGLWIRAGGRLGWGLVWREGLDVKK